MQHILIQKASLLTDNRVNIANNLKDIILDLCGDGGTQAGQGRAGREGKGKKRYNFNQIIQEFVINHKCIPE